MLDALLRQDDGLSLCIGPFRILLHKAPGEQNRGDTLLKLDEIDPGARGDGLQGSDLGF